MPELPEVETIVRQLQSHITGKTILAADVKVQSKVSRIPRGLFPAVVKKVWRRAKVVIIELSSGFFLCIRLGMTGHFHYVRKGSLPLEEQKYLVISFRFADGSMLFFTDVRKFGSVSFLSKEKLALFLSEFGPEPLSAAFTLPVFRDLLAQKQKAVVKVTLLDQHFIAGIGNIYAQEALFRAGIDPRRKIGSLLAGEIPKLHAAIRTVLWLAVKHNGTTVQDYIHIEGSGGFQRFLKVYEKQKCPRKHLLRKIYLGGRGTYYCPRCQR